MATILRSEKLMRKKRRQRALIGIAVGVSFLLVAIVPTLLSRADFLTIREVVVRGNTIVETSAVQQVVRDSLQGRRLLILTRSSAFTYPKRDILDSVSVMDPRIKDVEVSLSGMNTIEVSMTERSVFALWCNEEDVCLAMDASGYIFGDVPDFSSGDVYPLYSGLFQEDPIGKQFLPVSQFETLESYRKGLQAIELAPARIRLFEDGTAEALYDNGSKIIFSVAEDSKASLSNLVSILNDPSVSLVKDGMLQVYSIDLRFGNKVVVKKEAI